MFFNIAWRNAKRSRNENLIYFLTLVTAVASFYIVLSLRQQDVIRFLGKIESDAVNRLLTTLMPTVYFCALLLLFFLAMFANKYQMECRSRELGLYLILGMKKKRLFVQIMAENLITSIIALLGGILIGAFLSEIISLTTARLVGQGVITHQSSVSISGIVGTIIGFMIIQIIVLLILCARLFKRDIYQLLYGEIEKKQNVGNIRGDISIIVLGVMSLIVSYGIVIKYFFAFGGAMLLIAVLLGAVGTILCIRGLAMLLSILAASSRKKATKGLYSFTLRQFQENVANKYISISIASILIMFAVILIADGTTTIISQSSELTRGAAVYDFTVTGDNEAIEQYLTSDKMKPYVENLNRIELGHIKHPSEENSDSIIDCTKLREAIEQRLSAKEKIKVKNALGYDFGSNISPALNLYGAIATSSESALIPVSAYNRLLKASGEEILTISNNEAFFYLNPDFFDKAQKPACEMLDNIIETVQTQDNPLIRFDETPLYLVPCVATKGLTADSNDRVCKALIISDELFEKYVDSNDIINYWDFCLPEKMTQADGLLHSVMNVSEILKSSGFYYESYLNNYGRQLFYIVSESYTMLYMGFMLLLISCALIALQFLMQMQTTKNRYLILSMLGAKQKQMKKSMHRQVVYFFLLPILLACISGTIGLYALQVNLPVNLFDGTKVPPLLFVIAGAVVLIFAIYAVVVARTANREIAKMNWKLNS